MKVLIIIFLLAGTSISALFAQNVGIGTNTPSQPLDVNGNVNISGNLLANGNTGPAGSVLMSTGTGLTWGSSAGYKFSKMFFTAGSGSWTVPAGVTEIMVEAWGAGSGYADRMGGTSGCYASTVQAVTAGSNIAFTIGIGGGYNGPGSNTEVQIPGGTLVAQGGAAASFSSGRTNYPVNIPPAVSSRPGIYVPGNIGKPDMYTFGQKTATIFTQTTQLGSGGAPVGFANIPGQPGNYIYYENAVIVFSIFNNSSTTIPSSGGVYPGVGGTGMIIFWWK